MSIVGTAGAAAGGAFKALGFGFRHPMGIGAGIGGIAGLIGGEGSITQRLETAGLGAIYGGLGGLGLSAAPGLAWGAFKSTPKAVWKGGKAGWNVGKMGFKAANFALEHPLLTVGTVAGGLTAASFYKQIGQSGFSPTLQGLDMRANYNEQAVRSQEMQSMFVAPPGVMGSAPEYMNTIKRLQASTNGLTQGMWANRHG